MIEIELIHADARIPSKAHKKDAGYDIYAIDEFKLMPSELRLCPTGFKMAVPEGHVALLRGRSGLGLEGIDPIEFYEPDAQPIKLLGGVIDEIFRGQVGVILKNLGGSIKIIRKGDRICQMLIIPLYDGDIGIVKKLSETERGDKGFGSTSFPDPSQYIK